MSAPYGGGPWEEPAPPPPASPMATASAVLGVLSFTCFGPLTALPAVICGIVGLQEHAREAVRGGNGKSLAITGLALGGLNLLMTAGLIASAVFGAVMAPGPTAYAPTPMYTYSPPVPVVPTPGPHAKSPGRAPDGGQVTPIDEVTETHAGKVTLVDIPASARSLAAELRTQQVKANAAHERLVLFVVSLECRPCMSIAAVLPDPKMQAAFDHVRLVRVATDGGDEDLAELGIPTHEIPAFFLLGADLWPTDGITGAEWDDDTADNAAPVLKSFLHGTYKVRKKALLIPHRPAKGPADPRPPSTLL